jgi:hypothetical protein
MVLSASEWAFEKCAHGVGAVNATTTLFSCCEALSVLNLNCSSENKYIHIRENMNNLN